MATPALRLSTSVKSIDVQLVILRVPGTTSHTPVAQSPFFLHGIEQVPLGRHTDVASEPEQRALKELIVRFRFVSQKRQWWHSLRIAVGHVDGANTSLEPVDDI